MKTKIFYLIIFIIFLVLFFSRKANNYHINHVVCFEKEEKYAIALNVIIENKFFDSLNHNFKTLLLTDLINGSQKKIYLINESGGYFNKVVIGDILKKERKSLVIHNLTQNRYDTLQYNCSKK